MISFDRFRYLICFPNGSVNPMTRTFSVIAEIDNSDHGLKPGMFAEVKLDEPAAIESESEEGAAEEEQE